MCPSEVYGSASASVHLGPKATIRLILKVVVRVLPVVLNPTGVTAFLCLTVFPYRRSGEALEQGAGAGGGVTVPRGVWTVEIWH